MSKLSSEVKESVLNALEELKEISVTGPGGEKRIVNPLFNDQRERIHKT